MGLEALFVIAFLAMLGLGALCTFVGFVTMVGWVASRFNRDPAFVYLDGNSRNALLALLTRIRHADDPLQALDASISELTQRGRLPGATAPTAAPPAPPQAAPAEVPEPAAASASAALPTPDAPPPAAEPTAVPVSAAAPPASVGRWLAPDTITLLLYLGAALVVIAAGVFVASSWDAIGGVARWATVAVGAVGFLGTGELFVRRSTRLERAGETFRGLGTVLLPFVVLAYDRFVLDGDAPPAFWAGSGAALALLYYAFYRWSNPGRLTAYLAPLSAGIFALVLPETLGLEAAWQPIALLLLSAGLFAVAWRMEPDGRALVGRLTARHLALLAESHLLVGGLMLLASLALIGEALAEPGIALGYAVLLTGLLVALAFWFRAAGLLALALLASGWAVYQGTALLAGASPSFELILVGAWLALAFALFALPHRVHPWLAGQRLLLDAAAAWWATAAFLAASAFITMEAQPVVDAGLVLAVVSLVSGALFVALAARHRTMIPLWPALLLLHLAILGLLSLMSSDSDSALLPTLIWLGLAALWLGGDMRPPVAWSRRFWAAAFAAEALWLSFFALSERPLAALAGVVLTAGWLWLATRRQASIGVAAALLQGVYALFALLVFLNVPAALFPPVVVGVAAALVVLAPRLPAYAQRPTESAGLLLALVAPLSHLAADVWDAPTLAGVAARTTAQLSLLLAAALYALRGWQRRVRLSVAIAGVLLYLLYCWVALTREATAVQLYTVPLALLILSFGWLFPTRRAALEWLSAFVLLVPAALQMAAESPLLYSLLLGAWSLALLALGITLSRRTLVLSGSAGLLLAALRQIWGVLSTLPPGIIVGVVGLTIMILATLLALFRDTLMQRLGRLRDENQG